MVTPSATYGVNRSGQRVQEWHTEGSGQSEADLSGRIDPVPDLTGPGSGHRNDGQTGHPGCDHLHHQVREAGEASILEVVDQVSGDTGVLEGGYEPDPSLEDPLAGRSQSRPAPIAEKAAGKRMTGLTEHPSQLIGRARCVLGTWYLVPGFRCPSTQY